MKREELYMKLFNFSRPTYYKKKREQLAAIVFFEKYFTDDEIQEFLETGEISFLEERKIKKDNSVLSKILEEIETLKHKVELLERKK